MDRELGDLIERLQQSGNKMLEEAKNEKNEVEPKSTWSSHQILEHVTIVNRSYIPLFKKLVDGSYSIPFLRRSPFIAKWLGKEILKATKPSSVKKIKTFKSWEPKGEASKDQVLTEYVEYQKEMVRWFRKLEKLWELNPIVASPVNRNITYRLRHALEIITVHQERHLLQLKNLNTTKIISEL